MGAFFSFSRTLEERGHVREGRLDVRTEVLLVDQKKGGPLLDSFTTQHSSVASWTQRASDFLECFFFP